MTGCCQAAVTPSGPDRFIRLYENTRKKSEEEKEKKGGKSKRRWRESREEVKDSGEKEFLETYISSLKDRGETLTSDQPGASGKVNRVFDCSQKRSPTPPPRCPSPACCERSKVRHV